MSFSCSDIHRLTIIRLAVLDGSRFEFSLFCFTVRTSESLLTCAQMNYYSVWSFLRVIFSPGLARVSLTRYLPLSINSFVVCVPLFLSECANGEN